MPFKINNKFKLYDIVYLICDSEQYKRQVVSIIVIPGDELMYTLACDGDVSEHYEGEISSEKDLTQ